MCTKFEVIICDGVGTMKRQNEEGQKTLAIESKNFKEVIIGNHCKTRSKILRIEL